MLNQIESIHRSGTDPEDIIVSLDGDDWFNRADALQLIADTYGQHDCWLTYGSWVTNRLNECGEMWPAYPEGTTNFREWITSGVRAGALPWPATAVRTWKRWLWRRIPDADFRDESGEYFRVAEDRAIMLPLLEMAGTERAKHIAEPLMMYNQSSAHPELEAEAVKNVRLIHGRPHYSKIAAPGPLRPRTRTLEWIGC
jgi:hypothetical protein